MASLCRSAAAAGIKYLDTGAVPEALIELLAMPDEITGVLPVPQVGIYDNSCHGKTGQ